ncbi:hypothetical protein RCIA197 [Methanocella arvoryzae MRE50]|uniref:Uncharacterized protein n=1 Tax=Methanocella arvoryzae (strain DSM 22066 / NBRC 105507 / MRE50) TaxID=351160 RepID=Q0W1P1_METAR|nr:hypothetical protein RCIA197 [Methanocella arvoryzae MRE50]
MLGQAVAAVYWSSLCGFEGYFTFFAAVRTSCLVHLSRAVEASGAPVSIFYHLITLFAGLCPQIVFKSGLL